MSQLTLTEGRPAREVAEACLGQPLGGSPGPPAPGCLAGLTLTYEGRDADERRGLGELHDLGVVDPVSGAGEGIVQVQTKVFTRGGPADGPLYWLDHIYVEGALRRRGCAAFFIGIVKVIARGRSLGPIYASLQPMGTPRVELPALIVFYKKCGFVMADGPWGSETVLRFDP